jgi:archaemetzincin
MGKSILTLSLSTSIYRSKIVLIVAVLSLVTGACSRDEPRPASNMAAAREAKAELKELRADIKKIEPFFKRMGKPGTSDWLSSHNEPGQTFEEYLDAAPTRPTKERQKIYILPLGSFTAKQRTVIAAAAAYLEAFYDLPVQQMTSRKLVAPSESYRNNRFTGTRQVKSGFILEHILKPVLPPDASALIAFTSEDLYPDESMNYVFGQASLDNRVGVWSLHRLDDNTDGRGFLLRTIKIAAHETGHMFSMRHCTKYECVMSGTNHLAETDSRPIDACPECMAKISWLSDIEPLDRYQKLEKYCIDNKLKTEADEFRKKAAALR